MGGGPFGAENKNRNEGYGSATCLFIHFVSPFFSIFVFTLKVVLFMMCVVMELWIGEEEGYVKCGFRWCIREIIFGECC